MLLYSGGDAVAGAPIKNSSRIRAILAMIESFRGRVAQLSASCWVERGSPLFRGPTAKMGLASMQMALQLRRGSGNMQTKLRRASVHRH